MLVCMQWTVSGPRSGLPGMPPWQGGTVRGQLLSTDADRCACMCAIVWYTCARRERVCPRGMAWVSEWGHPPLGWGPAGPTPPGLCLPGRGSPFSAPSRHLHLHVHLARQEPCPLTWLRKPGPREGPRPVQGSEAPQAEGAGHPGSETAVLLHPLQDLLWAASFYSRFFLSYIPFYGVRGALLLFVAVRYGQGQSGRD